MILNIIALILGFAALIKGADLFVDACVSIAIRAKIPRIVIGLTIAAIGTSAPEAAVSVTAAIGGSGDLAVANVIGSNIFNILVVIGLCAVLKPMLVNIKEYQKDFWVSVGATGLLLAMIIVLHQEIPRFGALIFLVAFVVYIFMLVRHALKNKTEESDEDSGKKPQSLWLSIVLTVLGIALIVAGGQATVWGATNIARAFGVTERIIGLTIVAIGTSLPELVTSIVAYRKGESGIAVGNIIGSNIFNLLFVLGLAGVITPLAVSGDMVLDMGVLIVSSFAFYIFAYTRKKISRIEGISMLALYAAYMTILFVLR